MKRITSYIIIAVLGLGSAFAEELREFKSSDGSKTFRGLLMDFDAKSETVKVRHQRGKIITFKLAILSEEDQDFVKKKAPMLAAAKGLRVETDMNRKSAGKNEAGTWLCEKINHSYDVAAENTLSKDLGTVEIEYSIFIERNRRDAESKNEVVTGTHSVSSFMGHDEESFTTQEVVLENWSDNPPIPTGGGGG
jgi:hypothetical protein